MRVKEEQTHADYWNGQRNIYENVLGAIVLIKSINKPTNRLIDRSITLRSDKTLVEILEIGQDASRDFRDLSVPVCRQYSTLQHKERKKNIYNNYGAEIEHFKK